MISKEKMCAGISNYLDREIMPHLPPIKALAAGTAAALYMRQLPALIDKIPVSMGVTDDSGNIDIDAIRDVLSAKITDTVPVDIPMIGRMTFDKSEVDKLYRYIMEAY